MKRKILIAVALVATLVAGIFVGGYVTSKYYDRHFIYMKATNDSDGTLRVLTDFREGRQKEALDELETILDGSLIILATYGKIPQENFVISSVQHARDYRAKYPWAGSLPNVNERVKALLSPEKQ